VDRGYGEEATVVELEIDKQISIKRIIGVSDTDV
jgi:hypothetical protein